MKSKLKRCTVAIDGPVGSGKGTIGKAVAAHFGFAHLDTGLLYRAVAKRALDMAELGQYADAESISLGLTSADLEIEGLRAPAVSLEASRVATNPGVRNALLDFQRKFANRNGGAVLDGRDIGTVICPDAEVKLFVTAKEAVRADRRFAELLASGSDITRARVLADLRARDWNDTHRIHAALRIAEDAVLIDTTKMTITKAKECAIEVVEKRIGTGQGI